MMKHKGLITEFLKHRIKGMNMLIDRLEGEVIRERYRKTWEDKDYTIFTKGDYRIIHLKETNRWEKYKK